MAARAWRRLGVVYLSLGFLDRWLRTATPCRVLVVVTHSITSVRPVVAKNPERLTARFLTRRDVRDLVEDESRCCSSAFASGALAKGDRCFGVFEEERLISYCWYSGGPTPGLDNLLISVGPRYLFSYKAYTNAEERGRGLHGYGVAAAAAQLASEGDARGIVAYIEANNLPSLLSAQRLGDEVVGFVVVYKTAGRVRSYATSGCTAVGFRVHQRECAEPLVGPQKSTAVDTCTLTRPRSAR